MPNSNRLIRIGEFAVCITCFSLSISTIAANVLLHADIRYTLVALPIVYSFLTLLDTLASIVLEPFMWTSWIPIALLGSVMFFLLTGFLISANHIDAVVYECLLIMYSFAGALFLFDVIESTRDQCSTKSPLTREAFFEKVHQQTSTSTLHSHFPPTPSQIAAIKDHVSIEKYELQDTNADSLCAQIATDHKKPCSYGGTFHVSKNATPYYTRRSDDMCYCPRPGIKTVPVRPTKQKIKQVDESPGGTYSMHCTDDSCLCNQDNYTYENIVQKNKMDDAEKPFDTTQYSRSYLWDHFAPSTSSSNPSSPVTVNGRECRPDKTERTPSPTLSPHYQAHLTSDCSLHQCKAVVRKTQSWMVSENRQQYALPGAAMDGVEAPTTINIKRYVTIKKEGSYTATPRVHSPQNWKRKKSM